MPGTRRGKILGWTSVVVAAILVAGALTAYLKVRSVYDSIGHLALSNLGKRPPQYTGALNILVFGTDKRAGLSRHLQYVLHVGTNQGENNTDTIMLLHISPGRGKVTALSLPRDLMVPAYACPASKGQPGQQADPAGQVQINSLYAIGGVSCLVETVEQETGIRVDHFIELGFGGFVNAINDMGGVDVCLPFGVNDANSGLHLTRGFHHINGTTALEFWRTRYSIGDGTDLQRIRRDQYMLAQVLRGVLHKGLLTSPLELVRVVRDLAGSMTTDTGMTQSDLLHIASSLSHISLASVQFITAPNAPDPVQPSQVVFAQPQARELFRALAHDTALPEPGTRKERGIPSAPRVAAVQPSEVKVTVLNGSGIGGVAAQAAGALSQRGFDVLGTGNATTGSGAIDYNYPNSVIEYAGPSLLPAAGTLSKQLPSVTLRQKAGLAPGTINLILGSNFTSLAPPGHGGPAGGSPTAKASPGPSVGSLARNYGGITGNVSCASDQGAFQGPNSP
jgi:LCP family protein required for cell wall assembly